MAKVKAYRSPEGAFAFTDQQGMFHWVGEDEFVQRYQEGWTPIATHKEAERLYMDTLYRSPTTEGIGSVLPSAAFMGGFGRGFTGGLSDVMAKEYGGGMTEDLATLRRVDPGETEAGEITGLIGSALLPIGPLGALGRGAAAVGKGVSTALGAGRAARLGGAVTRGAIEGAAITGGVIASEAALGEMDADRALNMLKVGVPFGVGAVLAGSLLNAGGRFVSAKLTKTVAGKAPTAAKQAVKQQSAVDALGDTLLGKPPGKETVVGYIKGAKVVDMAAKAAEAEAARFANMMRRGLEWDLARRAAQMMGFGAGGWLGGWAGGLAGAIVGPAIMSGLSKWVLPPVIRRLPQIGATLQKAGEVIKYQGTRSLTQNEFEELSRQLDEADPGAISSAVNLAAPSDYDQEALQRQTEQMVSTVMFLQSKKPRPVRNSIPADGWRPNQMELDEFSEYVAAVFDPTLPARQLVDERLTGRSVEVLEALHAEELQQHRELVKLVVDFAIANDHRYTDRQGQQLALWLGEPMLGPYAPDFGTMFQRPPKPRGAGAAKPAGPMSPPVDHATRLQQAISARV
jgi:hypothetical protein